MIALLFQFASQGLGFGLSPSLNGTTNSFGGGGGGIGLSSGMITPRSRL